MSKPVLTPFTYNRAHLFTAIRVLEERGLMPFHVSRIGPLWFDAMVTDEQINALTIAGILPC